MSRRPGAWAALAVCAAALALHAPLLRGQALVGWDVAALRAPWRTPSATAWNRLALDPVLIELPHAQLFHATGGSAWNPYTGLGERTGQFNWPCVTYPPAALLYRVAPAWLAQGLHSLLHLLAAGLAALAWLRWRGHGWRAALAGALAWELSTWAGCWLEASFFHSPLAPWAALTVWAAEAIARDPRLATRCEGVDPARSPLSGAWGPALPAIGLAAAFGGALLAGHPQLLALLALLALALVAAQAPRRLPWVVAGLGLAACAGAPRLLPLAAEFLDGHRAAPASWGEHLATTVRLGPRHLLLALFPDLLGHPVRGFNLLGPSAMRYANHQEVRLYLGLPVLVLALAGWSHPAVRRLRWVALGAGLLAFPPFAWLPARLPGLGSSSPARILWLTHLLAPALVACGWERFARRDRRVRVAACGVLAALLVVAALASTRWGAGLIAPPELGDPARVADVLAPWSRGLAGDGLPGLAPVGGGGRVGYFLAPTLGPLLLGGAIVWLVFLASADPHPRRRRWAASLLAGLLAGELVREGLTYNPTTAPARLFPSTLGIEAVEALTRDGQRVVLARGIALNGLMPFGVRAVGGYGSMHPRRLVRMFAAAGVEAGRQALRADDLPPAWRQALGVAAVLGPPGQPPAQPAGLREVYAGADARVWAQADPLPRARVHAPQALRTVADEDAAAAALAAPGFDPRRQVVLEGSEPGRAPDARRGDPPGGEPGGDRPGDDRPGGDRPGGDRPGGDRPGDALPLPRPARILVDEPETVVVEVTAPEGGALVLADAYAPGWTAHGPQGEPLRVEPAQVGLRGVRLPVGFAGPVTFRYAAAGSRAGLALGLLGWLALLVAWRGLRAR